MLPAEKPNTNTTTYPMRLTGTSGQGLAECADKKLRTAYHQGSKTKPEELLAIVKPDRLLFENLGVDASPATASQPRIGQYRCTPSHLIRH